MDHTYTIFSISLLATFVASVMAEDQQDRLRNGSFGAIAGSSLGGIAALLTDEKSLLLYGALGSTVGGFLAWVVYLILSWWASTKNGRLVLEYHVGGLQSLRDHIRADDQKLIEQSLDSWINSYSTLLNSQHQTLENTLENHQKKYGVLKSILLSWITIPTDVFNLILDAIAKKAEYKLRVTIIVFGKDEDQLVGKHWIKYSGKQPKHRTKQFDETSIAYKVLIEEYHSPFLAHTKDSSQAIQNREARSYHSFYAFRLNEFAVLSLDWPGHLEADDPYIQKTMEFFHIHLNPLIDEILQEIKPQAEKDLNIEIN